MEAVAVSLAARDDGEAVVEWVHDQAQRAGIAAQASGPDGDVVARRWFGTGVVQGGVEMSGMCFLFYQ